MAEHPLIVTNFQSFWDLATYYFLYPVLRGVNMSQAQPQALDDWTHFLFLFFAFSPVWRPLRYVHAIILPLKPFLSILNQPSSMGYYIDKVGNAVS